MLPKRNYQFFNTTLSDEFVEANVQSIIDAWGERSVHGYKPSAKDRFYNYLRFYLSSDDGFFNIAPPPTAMVSGTVVLWGDVVEHEHGYRTEFARVHSIDWLYPDKSMFGHEAETLAHLQKLYGMNQ